ncbi:hypothetical protein BaRGS_00027464 [Batillaria attramentaria]|uniref:C2H2-type domain-containing protein n=1 Tax=Batillaria attramentaria TaxID=370345 RepID=A0ABD0K1T2_9CAEN
MYLDTGVLSAQPRHNQRLRLGDRQPPYSCTRCGRQYSHQPGLIRHRKQCEGRYDIQCPVCYKQFHRRDACKQHILSKHPDYTENTTTA